MTVSNASTITIGRRQTITFSLIEALEQVIGFAFGVDEHATPYGVDNPYLYGYRTWDCALRDYAPGLSEADVLASTGMNSGVDVTVMLRILAVIDNDATLPDLGRNPDFWTLSPASLDRDPGAGHPEHELWEVWRRLVRLDGVAGAVCSKVVAHRWPTKFPLYDSKIALVYHADSTWMEICEDLQQDAEWWAELERRFDCYRANYQFGRGVPLHRVRMLDIMAWGHAVGFRRHLVGLGKPLLVGATDPDIW